MGKCTFKWCCREMITLVEASLLFEHQLKTKWWVFLWIQKVKAVYDTMRFELCSLLCSAVCLWACTQRSIRLNCRHTGPRMPLNPMQRKVVVARFKLLEVTGFRAQCCCCCIVSERAIKQIFQLWLKLLRTVHFLQQTPHVDNVSLDFWFNLCCSLLLGCSSSNRGLDWGKLWSLNDWRSIWSLDSL